jgi:hypothetical protein
MTSTNTAFWLVTLAGIFGTWLIASTTLKARLSSLTVQSDASVSTVQVASASW